MTRLTHLLNNRIIIMRMARESGDKLMFTTVTADMGHIQPLEGSNTQIVEGAFMRAFKMYADADTDLQEGDKLRDENNDYFRIKSGGVTRRTCGSMDYLVVVLEQIKG